jgi:predicted enzyme related to lactoylglutathione lyase
MNVPQREGTEHEAWPGAIAAITLFVDDLEAAKRFYREVFELPVGSRTTTRRCSGSEKRSSTC